ncbi:MAG: hypothetical protein Q4P24_02380 [Rhodobacterales bacterium]|nr:hypothetical protein [Rhodobacterales bacterium]
MTRLTPALAAFAVLFAAPFPLAAQDLLPTVGDSISNFRSAGAWEIRKNETRGVCFASYKSESGAIVQFGFASDEKAGYLGLFSQRSPDMPATQEIAVLANGNLYVGEAIGVGSTPMDGYEGGYIVVNNPEFAKDIEAGKELVAFPEMAYTFIVDMRGAKTAMYEVRKCTSELKRM